MSRVRSLIVGLASLAAAAACSPSADIEQERAALMSADRAWSQTTRDPQKFVSYFAEGASIYPAGMPRITGGDAILKTYTEMSKAPGFALAWTPAKAEVSASADIGYTAGTYEMTIGGTTEKGKYITVWRKQAGGEWKVTDDIFNADSAPKPPAGDHIMVSPDAVKWGDPPPGLPAGARAAIISGDPTQAQPYVVRAQLPANYRIPPHWHPTTENVTVLSGTVAFGMGDKFDAAALRDVPAGGFAVVPAEMRHFFVSKTASTIQIHGMGPFGITYVDPADDSRTRKSD